MRHESRSDPSVEDILGLLEAKAPRPLSIAEIARALEFQAYDRRRMKSSLEELVSAKKLRRIGKTRYQWLRPFERTRPSAPGVTRLPSARRSKAAERVEGIYSKTRIGVGFVEVLGRAAERFQRDILIPPGLEGTALHGDRVAVEVTGQDPRTRRVIGRIATVTERVHERILGTLERRRGRFWVIPEQEALPPIQLNGDVAPSSADLGKVALVRLTRPPGPSRLPAGELERIVGDPDDPEVQFLTIALEHGRRVDFPPEVAAEAEGFPPDPAEADFSRREDLRNLAFVTIDGETARDFDDAVCLEPLPRGGYRLRVAIADVSHYVRPGSALDSEAARRGTSVYFPDRAIPMLPPRLSNQLCSLNPDRPRLVLVAELEYDRSATRKRARFYRGVMRSHARLTYTQVAAMLSEADTPEIHAWRQRFGALLPQLRLMHQLMRQLWEHRVRNGSLDLDLPETLVDLSEEGRSLGVRLFQRNDAHRIIEEFMLEANRAIAQFLEDHELPFPYRIHESPDTADVDDLNAFLGAFGFTVRYDGAVRPQDIQKLLDAMKGHPLVRVLSRLTLRSMKQAQYSTHNHGHFGLAFPIYCHFTSPIRRYPDLLVHRQLNRLLDGEIETAREEAAAIEGACVDGSQRERQAMEAERAMLDLKKAEFMTGHLLEPEPGTIISVMRFGFFVEIDSYPVEGLVRVESLPFDQYRFDEMRHALIGMRRGRRYRLGDRVLVEATNVSLRRREVDLALLEHLEPPAARPARQRARGRSRFAGG